MQIPTDGADNPDTPSPEAELTKRFKDVMRRIFWDRLTQSLLPPPPPPPAAPPGAEPQGNNPGQNPAERMRQQEAGAVQEGSKVQAHYRSERGSFYTAMVLKVITQAAAAAAAEGGDGDGGGGGTGGVIVAVDLRYDDDGTVERGVPMSRLRISGDPPDFGPLLSLLAEVMYASAVSVKGWRGISGAGAGANMIRK